MKWPLVCSFVLVCLTGCAPHGKQFAPADTSIVAATAESIHTHVTQVLTDTQAIQKNGTKANSPEINALVFKVTGLETESNGLRAQVADLKTQIIKTTADGNAEISKQTGRADKAEADKAAMEPRHKRDLVALAIVFWMGCVLATLGPLLRDEYPVLLIIPAPIAGGVAALAGFIVGSGIVGLLTLFGVL